MNKKRTMNKIIKDQTGLVSIVVTTVIILILSLLVLAFTGLVRREQRQSLDLQLSTQAFYAAESGVNDAVNKLKTDSTLAGVSKTKCGGGNSNNWDTLSQTVNGDVSYSCLLVDAKPTQLQYDDVAEDESKVIPINSGTGTNLQTITISWQSQTGSTDFDCGTVGSFTPDNAAWPCQTGVLRADLVPLTSLTRASLAANTLTAFMVPSTSGAGAYSYIAGYAKQGQVIAASCSITPPSGERFCKVVLDVSVAASSKYSLHVRSIYSPSVMTITATDSGGAVGLSGAQAVVDSTGKAGDVLRRVQVRIRLGDDYASIPNFVLQSTDTLCKRLVVRASTVTVNLTGLPGGVDTTPCNP